MSAHRNPIVAAQVRDSRAYLRRQVRQLFAAELAGDAAATGPSVDALCSFESYQLLRHDQGLSRAWAATALRAGLAASAGPGDRRRARRRGGLRAVRGTVRRHVRIARPADEVWALVGDPVRIPEWFTGITAATVEGSTRVVTTGSGLPMPEEIVTNDPLQRRFQYRITAPIVHEHLSTLDVIALGDRECLVVYAADADPSTLALVIAGAAGAALEQLRRTLEADT